MTVLAFSRKHKQLASDSLTSFGDMVFDNHHKIFQLANGAYLACAGDSDSRDVMDVLGKCTYDNPSSRKDLAETRTWFQGILVFPDQDRVYAVFIEPTDEDEDKWTASVHEIMGEFVALGHGMEFAYGVLEAGGTPEEAVKATCKRDLTCGLPVQVVNFQPKVKKVRKTKVDTE